MLRPSRSMGVSAFAMLATLVCGYSPATAQSHKVRVSDLTDIVYGTINNLQADSRRSQSICVSASATDGLYSVTATGTGPGGALELSSGAFSLPYSVEWSTAPSQSFGASLVANEALVGQSTPEKQQDCKSRGLQTASLIVILRGAELGAAIQGSYSGTLTILIAAQ